MANRALPNSWPAPATNVSATNVFATPAGSYTGNRKAGAETAL